MSYPSKFEKIAAERGQTVAEMFVDELNRHETLTGVSRSLRISYRRVVEKYAELPIQRDVIYRLRQGGEHA